MGRLYDCAPYLSAETTRPIASTIIHPTIRVGMGGPPKAGPATAPTG